ncbi:hypothetical protein B0H14DRAFT_2596545 [Mycena olivaceomarginata]|nr:hypothetical protein B0H14DRAFT_2596545 [Mycena olivaceomarginata]
MLTRATSRYHLLTASVNHESVLHDTMEDNNDPEGAPPCSMYIDDQAEEDTDAEIFPLTLLTMECIRWRLSKRGKLWLALPTQRTKSQALRPRQRSITPPSSKTTVAHVIRAHICRYFDEQAEDSDEDAGEDREEEEQEMEEDREFVDDTSVDEDFVHCLPSNKDDTREVEKWVAHFQNKDKIAHYKRDVAREAVGEAGAPSAEQKRMLSPRELVLYNKAKHLRTNMQITEFERALHWEMLADVDVELYTWRWFPKVEPSFAEIALFAESTLSGLSRVVLAKPSPALNAGDRVVVMTGDRKDSTGRIRGVADVRIAGKRVAMAQVVPPAPKPYAKGKAKGKAPAKPASPFDVSLAQLKRHGLDLYYHLRIHDRVRVVSGALYVGAIGRVEEVEGDFLTVAIPKDWEVAGATWPSPPSDINKLFIISIVHITCQWAIGDSVRVTRGQYEGQVGVILALHNTGYVELLEANVGYSTYKDVPHSCKVRCSDVDFEHELWTTIATNHLPSAGWSESNSDIDLTVSLTLPFSQLRMSQRGFEGIEVIVAKSDDFIPQSKEAKKHERGEGHIHIPHKGFIGMIISDFNSRERSDRLKNGVEPHHEKHTGKLLKPVDSTCLRNPDVAGIMLTIRGDHSLENRPGENNRRWLCQPELVGRRLDIQILGIATLANSMISKVQRTLEGSCGWVLLSEMVTTKMHKVDVCSVGKNQNTYSIDKRYIKPRRDIDSGKWLVEITERVVVIGPDRESDRARTGQYALAVPSYLHAYGGHIVAVKFVDGAHGFYPMNSLCLSQNIEVVLGSHTFPATTFL